VKAPVFIVGSPRSGTTLLYHMLLSSGGFAVYRAETHVFNMIVPRFGSLDLLRTKQNLMDKWLQSHFFKLSGLQAKDIRSKILSECRNGGDFLRIVMESIAHNQGVDRWSEKTPAHLIHIPEIKKTIPDALFIHIIRDGRDVALSLDKLGWIDPFPWDRKHSLLVAGLYWEWVVRKGREYGRRVAPHYIEIRFEDLINEPHETLRKLSNFINHDLDFDQIQRVGIGSIKEPNTAFRSESRRSELNVVQRWKRHMSEGEIVIFESLVGDFLRDLGYHLITSDVKKRNNFFRLRSMRALYKSYYTARQWAKTKTPLSRFLVNIELLNE